MDPIMKKILSIALVTACLILISNCAQANDNISIGVKLLGANWQGDNGGGANEFDSSNGGQFGVNIAYSVGNFYTGLNLQGGEYKFAGIAPDQFTTTGRVPVSNVNITQNDFDLLIGYYFWPQVSLFADVKSVQNNWRNNDYEQTFLGLGLGISAFTPLNEDWTLFGSFGFIPNGKIEDTNDNKVGDGDSIALELGAVYKLNDTNHLNLGIKFRNYNFEHLNNSKQEYSVNAIFIGYTHTFALD